VRSQRTPPECCASSGSRTHTRIGAVEVFLKTDRLILRRFTVDNLDLLVELDSDAEVMRFINNGAPVDRAELAETLDWWEKVTAATMAVNLASRRVMEKAGLRYVRTFHANWPRPHPRRRAG
jgi:RimJ/RimL family protein N-acetyltransferase